MATRSTVRPKWRRRATASPSTRWRSIPSRVRADNTSLSIGYTRSRIPPWGVDGGLDGTPNYVEVLRPGKDPERYAFGTDIPLNTDDVVRVVTGNGGGFGDPKKRSAAAIADDIKNGYLTPERAAEIYGYHAEAAE